MITAKTTMRKYEAYKRTIKNNNLQEIYDTYQDMINNLPNVQNCYVNSSRDIFPLTSTWCIREQLLDCNNKVFMI